MWKKGIGLVLSLCFLCSVCACGQKTNTSASDSSTAASSSAKTSGSSSSKSPSGSSSKSSSSSSKKKASSSSSSSAALTDAYCQTLAKGAIYKEVKKKYSLADPDSTKISFNKTEKGSTHTTVYGKLYLYDKYGKLTTGHADKSGSSIRTFEVKISNSSKTVTSCTVK